MKPHAVWLKVPLCEAEVESRHATRAAAEKAAKALEKRAKAWESYGACSVWVESPGTVEEKLRKMHEASKEG